MFMYLTLHLMEFYGVFTHFSSMEENLFFFFSCFAVQSRKGGGRTGGIWDDAMRWEGGKGVAATDAGMEC